MSRAGIVKKVSSWNSGGGVVIDVVELRDGRILGISDEAAVLYKSVDDLESGDPAEKRPCIRL